MANKSKPAVSIKFEPTHVLQAKLEDIPGYNGDYMKFKTQIRTGIMLARKKLHSDRLESEKRYGRCTRSERFAIVTQLLKNVSIMLTDYGVCAAVLITCENGLQFEISPCSPSISQAIYERMYGLCTSIAEF